MDGNVTIALRRDLFGILLVCVIAGIASAQAPRLKLTAQESGTDVLLIGISPVSDSLVWVSGTGGTVLRTTNGGADWQIMKVPGADSLQFRDVHGVDVNTAYVLSSGEGNASRIYKTEDGGETWHLQFKNPGPGGFFDCMDFWDPKHGIAFSDSYEGSFILIQTDDGGLHWKRIPPDVLPRASEGEGSFAASGTCLRVLGDSTVVVGTGAGTTGRLLKSTDRGTTWQVYETPITAGTTTSGISSLSFIDESSGYAFGVELTGDDEPIHNVVRTSDGGRTWILVNAPQLPDIYGGVAVPLGKVPLLVAVGPKGIDYSSNGGEAWTGASKLDHWGIAFADIHVGWATGPQGRITKLTVLPEGP